MTVYSSACTSHGCRPVNYRIQGPGTELRWSGRRTASPLVSGPSRGCRRPPRGGGHAGRWVSTGSVPRSRRPRTQPESDLPGVESRNSPPGPVSGASQPVIPGASRSSNNASFRFRLAADHPWNSLIASPVLDLWHTMSCDHPRRPIPSLPPDRSPRAGESCLRAIREGLRTPGRHYVRPSGGCQGFFPRRGP